MMMEMILEGGHVDLAKLDSALRSDLSARLSPADVINIVEVVEAFQGSKIPPELISKIMLMQKAVESDISSPELSSQAEFSTSMSRSGPRNCYASSLMP